MVIEVTEVVETIEVKAGDTIAVTETQQRVEIVDGDTITVQDVVESVELKGGDQITVTDVVETVEIGGADHPALPSHHPRDYEATVGEAGEADYTEITDAIAAGKRVIFVRKKPAGGRYAAFTVASGDTVPRIVGESPDVLVGAITCAKQGVHLENLESNGRIAFTYTPSANKITFGMNLTARGPGDVGFDVSGKLRLENPLVDDTTGIAFHSNPSTNYKGLHVENLKIFNATGVNHIRLWNTSGVISGIEISGGNPTGDGVLLDCESGVGTDGEIGLLVEDFLAPYDLTIAGDSGTANAAVTTTDTTLTDTREAWAVDQWVGALIRCNGMQMTVTSNTATTLTGAGWSLGGNPGNGFSWTVNFFALKVNLANDLIPFCTVRNIPFLRGGLGINDYHGYANNVNGVVRLENMRVNTSWVIADGSIGETIFVGGYNNAPSPNPNAIWEELQVVPSGSRFVNSILPAFDNNANLGTSLLRWLQVMTYLLDLLNMQFTNTSTPVTPGSTVTRIWAALIDTNNNALLAKIRFAGTTVNVLQFLMARQANVTSDPANPANWYSWFRSDLTELRMRLNGATYRIPISPATAPVYTETNVTPDRSYDANATTVDELADVLGTLIADLRATGIID